MLISLLLERAAAMGIPLSEAQAGTWTFHHYAKTHFGIMIDDTEISKPGANIDTTVTKALTAGWHKFMVSVYTSGANAQIGPYSGADAIEFKAPGDTDYTVFDSTTVPMRMRQHLGARTSVRWRKFANPGNNLGVYATCDESNFAARDTITNTLAALHASYATGVNAPNGGGVGRFDGYFKVDKENAGQWTFTGKYGICETAAYSDLALIKQLIPALAPASRDFYRKQVSEMLLETYNMAKARKDTKAMAMAAKELGKVNRVDLEDEKVLPYDDIVIQPFTPSSDPTIIGLKVIPNLEEVKARLRKQMAMDNPDIEDIEYEPADLEEESLFPEVQEENGKDLLQ